MVMKPIESVYIVEPADSGWIIERLMRDISSSLGALGVSTRIGPMQDYQGEDVLFQSRFLTSIADSKARINSLFITHIDDKIRELELRSKFSTFNSLVCLSPHDAEFVSALGASRKSVVGIDSPARSSVVRPIRLALFSGRYADGRKNEQWILDYFQSRPASYRQNFVICFLGWDWEGFCADLSKLETNFEIYRYSRYTPGEYQMYQQVLSSMDSLFYLGFDGGAMSVYDALGAGLNAIMPDVSYHRGLGSSVSLFEDRDGFFRELDRLNAENEGRRVALQSRSAAAYAKRLLNHWNGIVDDSATDSADAEPDPQIAARFRSRYQKVNASRLRSALIRLIQSLLLRMARR
jgi:hypothetical protein